MAIFDNGLAPITNVAEEAPASVPRSKFNMSCVKYTNGIIGALEPIDVLETLPNEDYEIGYDILAQLRNPTVRQALNGMKIFIHSYWCPKKDLWKGFKNYITGGRSGNVTLEVPKLLPVIGKGLNGTPGLTVNADGSVTPDKTDVNTFVPFAPSSFMGLPIVKKYKANETLAPNHIYNNKNYWFGAVPGAISEDINFMQGSQDPNEPNDVWWGVSALPFVMYNKIYRDYYANENMLSKNKNWYHDDEEDDLILPYTLPNGHTAGYTNCTDGNIYSLVPSDFKKAHVPQYSETETNGDKPILNLLHFRQFRGDYFTTANIFRDLLRGDGSKLDEELGFDINWDKLFEVGTSTSPASTNMVGFPMIATNGANKGNLNAILYQDNNNGMGLSYSQTTGNENRVKALKTYMEQATVKGSNVLGKLRKAIVLEKLMMRNATTNGSYRELIGIQFGYYPSDYTRRPTLIGGTSYDVNFTTVTATNYDASTNNLGQKNSDGYASGSGYIGKFHSDDHGYIMTILSIVPDVYYATQGLDTMFTRTTRDQEYTPILNNLEPMAIKNKELFITKDKEYNENVWGYADRFEDWKSRRNKVSGLAVCGELYDRAQFMFRKFSEANKPNLNENFLSMFPSNIDMSMFTTPNEPPFDLTIGCNITKVSPMPYKAHPADMGINY